MTLLVPVDFSDCTTGLVDEAARLAARLGAQLTLLHAIAAPAGLASARLEGGDAQSQLRRESELHLSYYVGRARRGGVEVDGITRDGAPAETILGATEELGAEMIVMGTHGRKGVNRMLLGSVAEQVLRRADVPVMTFRTQHRPECEARNCATCSSDVTAAQKRLAAELDG